MSDQQDWADLNKPLPDPGPRDGRHGEGENWGYDEQGQTASSPDDEPANAGRRRFGFHRRHRDRTTKGG